MTLKVLHVAPVWLPATQTWMWNQVRFLPDDIEAHVACERTENLDHFAVPHLHIASRSPVRWAWDRAMRRLGLRRYLGFARRVGHRIGARVLHSHFGTAGWRDLGLARRLDLAHVVTFYGADVHQAPRQDPRWRDRYRTLFREVDRVLCEGPFMADSLVRQGIARDKVRVHPLGVDLEHLPWRAPTWKPGEPLKVLIAGTFREKKGIPDALLALGRFRRETRVALEVLLIGDAAGKPGDEAEKHRIERILADEDLASCTRRTGFVPYDTLLAELADSDVFLSPSLTAADGDCEGGAPVTIIEAAALGVPVVSTRHCDIPHVVRDGETGWLADERDVDGLVAHLVELVTRPEAWELRTRAGRAHVEASFDARIQGERLAGHYRQLSR